MYYFAEYTTFDGFFSLYFFLERLYSTALYKSYQLLLLCGIFAPEMPQNYFCKNIFYTFTTLNSVFAYHNFTKHLCAEQ